MLDWERSDDSGIVMHDPDQLEPGPWQPRRNFVEAKIAELAASIAEVGVLQNLVAQQPANGGRALIISGESRWRGASRVPGARLPVRLVNLTPAQCLTIALIENLGRNDLTALEEAAGYAKYFEYEPDITQSEIGRRIGRDQSHVANMLSLLQLPDEVRELIDAGVLAWSLARDQLVRWAKEEPSIRYRFFRTLLTQINARADAREPVTRVWLGPMVTKLAEIYSAPAPVQETMAKGAAAAAPAKKAPGVDQSKQRVNALTNHKIEASSFKGALNNATIEDCNAVLKVVRKKIGQKKRVSAIEKRLKELQAAQRKAKKPAGKKRFKQEDIEEQAAQATPTAEKEVEHAVVEEPAPDDSALGFAVREPEVPAEPAHSDTPMHIDAHAAEVAEAVCIYCGCKDSEACVGGCVWTAVDRERGLGVCSRCEPSAEVARSALAADRELVAEGGEEPSVGGFIGALLPLLDDCSVTLAIARLAQPSETICIVVTPKQIQSKQQIAPLTVSGTAAELEAQLLARLPAYVTNLLGVNAPAEA